MALLRSFEDHEYWPEYGTLLIRDSGPFGPARVPVGELLDEYAVDTQPCGSVARGGDGWLDGRASDQHHAVRLEAHDAEPELDLTAWADVVETPMATGGRLALSMVTGGVGRDPFRVGEPGLYRVRFCRRPAEEGDSYLLQFWPVDAPPDPPRWFARSSPLLAGGNGGWDDVFGWQVGELIWAVHEAAADGPASTGDLVAWAVRHGHSGTWLSESLSPADLDAAGATASDRGGAEAARQRGARAEAARQRWADLAEAARALGVAAPHTRAGLLPLLVAAGVLTAGEGVRGEPGYRVVAGPRPAWEVLRLPGRQIAMGRERSPRHRYCYAVSDLIALLLWGREAGVQATLGWLAERMRATPATVRDIIDYAVESGALQPLGGPGDADGPDAPDEHDAPDGRLDPHRPLRLRVVPRKPPARGGVPAQAPRPATRVAVAKAAKTTAVRPTSPLRSTAARARPAVAARWVVAGNHPDAPPAPPAGAPPRAGMVGQKGDLVVWRDGEPVVLGSWPGTQLHAAVQSRYGTVLLASTQAALLSPGGEFHLLGTDLGLSAAIDPTGRRLAIVESHLGRRSRSRLHLYDLSDRSRQTMPWPEEDAHLAVVGVRGDAVYFQPARPEGTTRRWVPGSDPEPLPHRLHWLDPYTGTALGTDGEPGLLLIGPDGTVRRLAAKPGLALAPGATHLYSWRYEPPALLLSDFSAPEQPRALDLPAGSQTASTIPIGPVWEDPGHVLVPARHGRNAVGVPLVRMDVRTGALEGIALPDVLIHRPLLVRPLPEPADGTAMGG